jgi:hydroxymethylpyrimidine/phosphomethylpyrimidine kinase
MNTCKPQKIPVALTIAGSDSGGGAGIQADLKTFAAIGVHGTSAIACVTAQNPKGVFGIQPVKAEMVTKQLEAIFAEFQPRAAKTGMLFSTEIIRAVAKFFRAHRRVPLIVDPVMIATSSARLLKPSAVQAMEKELLPLALLVTPNLAEAGVLIGRKILTPKEMQSAAKEIFQRFGCAALVKGGHLRSGAQAIDIFYDGKTEIILRSGFISGISTHGTGCTFSAAIAARVAHGDDLRTAVRRAKKFITRAIRESIRVSSHNVLRNF